MPRKATVFMYMVKMLKRKPASIGGTILRETFLPDTSLAIAYGYNGIFSSYNDGFALTSPFGTFPANTFGLYDMSGNLMEWCSDWMDWDYYQKSPSLNPAGPSYGNDKITRGGSWCIYPDFCKVIHRYVESPNGAFGTVGFRVARSR